MQGFQLILLPLIFVHVLSTNSASTVDVPIQHADCPLIDDEQHPVLLPNPNNCRQYYSCMLGLAYPKTCPDNLHWSAITYRCDRPEVAKCTYSEFTGASSLVPTTSVLLTPETPLSYVYRENEYNCNQFYQCALQQCPPNLYWNNRNQHCDIPQNANCVLKHSIDYLTTTVPGITPSNFLSTDSVRNIPTAATPPYPIATATLLSGNGVVSVDNALNELCINSQKKYLSHPKNPHQFIHCNGIAFVQTCPANLIWNPKQLVCDHYYK